MKRIGILFLFFVLTLAAGYGQNSLLLSSSNGFSSNYVQLHWTWTPSKPAGNYSFTLFQWDNALGDWQSTSVKCDDTIRVLNVYPDIAGSNTLKTWMDDPSIGFGKILVTSVSITNFNNNPDSYLKNGSGEYIYDVIAFGFYNANNNKDLSPSATVAVRAFLDAGRGVLFGHDTQCYLFTNFPSLKDKTNLDIYHWPTYNYAIGCDTVKVIKDGFLLKYPHLIPYNVNLAIPFSHSTHQTAKGIVWMNFPCKQPSYSAPDTIINGGTNNFYLTTWNNAAMIQTGESNGQITTDEKKILANTLWYLAQFTDDTTADVCSAPDVTPPFPPLANWGTICGQITISTCDSGTVYKFYVKATNLINSNDTFVSNTLTVENKSGLRGYFISEDANPNGVPTVVRDASNNIITPLTIVASDSQQVIYTVQNPTFYIHIQAVDSAGNLSVVTTLKASDLQSVTTFYDTICANNPYTNHNFNIPASKLQTAGNFEFRDTIPSTTGACDTLIVLKLNVIECCQTQPITVRFKPDSIVGKDAYISTDYGCFRQGLPQIIDDMNFGNSPEINMSTWTTNALGCPQSTVRSLLKFDELATIPTNAVILSAELKLYGSDIQENSCYPGSPFNSYCPNTSFIQRVTSAWNEQTVTWNTQPSTTIVNQITIPQTTSQWNWNYTNSSANLLAMVQDWVKNPATNFGVMLRLDTEKIYQKVMFASSDHPNAALHPELIVTYELNQGGKKDTTILYDTVCRYTDYLKYGFILDGRRLHTAGTLEYQNKLPNIRGCDSLIILNLTVKQFDFFPIHDTVCPNIAYTKHGFNILASELSTSGTVEFRDTIFNPTGCDSVIVLSINVNPLYAPDSVEIFDTICPNIAYAEHGFDIPASKLQTAGMFEFRDTIPNPTGCRTLKILHLTVFPISLKTLQDTVCPYTSYAKHGFNISASELQTAGTYEYHLTLSNTRGCDSIVTLELTVVPSYDLVLYDTICQHANYYQSGFYIPSSDLSSLGNFSYQRSLSSMFACDSVVTLNLEVVEPFLRIEKLTDDFCEQHTAILEAVTNLKSVLWSTGSTEKQVTVNKSGDYMLTAHTYLQCKLSANIKIEDCNYQLFLPNTITPSNHDGLNDFFSLPLSVPPQITEASIGIYDRWGERVFYSNDMFFKWDGRVNGQLVINTVYSYRIVARFLDGTERTFDGHITVL